MQSIDYSEPSNMKQFPTSFEVIWVNQVPLIRVPEHLSKREADSFKETCKQLYQTHPLRIIVDFSQTTFMDSSGLGALISISKAAQAQGIEVALWSISGQIEMVFSMAGLDKFLTIDAGTAAISLNSKRSPNQQVFITHPSLTSRAKRLIDILGAVVGLGITAILFVPIAIAIILDSPGPIFFVQTRCGLMGQRFRLWKFRSMVVNAESLRAQVINHAEGAFFKNANDPRITRIGRFLRRSSLDELPQFWNVLKGDMSLVGTRPPLPNELEQYEVPSWQRLDVKPGITGEWQVKGRSKIKQFEDIITLDLAYQQNWSLLHDFKLILLTIKIVFSRDNGAC
jgi:anti-anti-sigma factor